MAAENQTIESKVAQVDIDIDEMFNPGVATDSVTLPEDNEDKPKSIFSSPSKKADFSFADKEETETSEADASEETTPDAGTKVIADDVKEEVSDLLDEFTADAEDDVEEEKEEKR